MAFPGPGPVLVAGFLLVLGVAWIGRVVRRKRGGSLSPTERALILLAAVALAIGGLYLTSARTYAVRPQVACREPMASLHERVRDDVGCPIGSPAKPLSSSSARGLLIECRMTTKTNVRGGKCIGEAEKNLTS